MILEKMYPVSYISLFVLLGAGCSGSVSTETESTEISNIIDLTAGFHNVQTVRLSEIADSVTFIPFETTSQSLQGQGQKSLINFTAQYIYYFNTYYDWEGNYCGKIGRRGQGPFEEPEGASSVLFKDNHFYSKGSKFIEYDKTGKPTGKVKNLYADPRKFGTNDFLRRGTAFCVVGENFAIYDYPTTLYFLNTDFEIVSSRVVTYADSLPPYLNRLGGGADVTTYKDKVLFYNFMNDTIFYVTDTGLESQWVVSFDDELRVSTDAILNYRKYLEEWLTARAGGLSHENTKLIQLTDNKHKVVAVYETETCLFFHMTELIFSPELRNKQPATPYYIIYDKKTGTTTRVKGNGFVDDLLDMDYFFPQLGIFDDKMITFMWPFEILDYVEECKSKGREVNPQLLELSQKIDPEDNPILILIHLKKKL